MQANPIPLDHFSTECLAGILFSSLILGLSRGTTLWHEIITKIIPWELFFVIIESFCALEMPRKERHFQGITHEIRNCPKIIISEQKLVSNNFVSEGNSKRSPLMSEEFAFPHSFVVVSLNQGSSPLIRQETAFPAPIKRDNPHSLVRIQPFSELPWPFNPCFSLS